MCASVCCARVLCGRACVCGACVWARRVCCARVCVPRVVCGASRVVRVSVVWSCLSVVWRSECVLPLQATDPADQTHSLRVWSGNRPEETHKE